MSEPKEEIKRRPVVIGDGFDLKDEVTSKKRPEVSINITYRPLLGAEAIAYDTDSTKPYITGKDRIKLLKDLILGHVTKWDVQMKVGNQTPVEAPVTLEVLDKIREADLLLEMEQVLQRSAWSAEVALGN